MADGALEVARGGLEQTDATIDTDPATFFAVLSGGEDAGGVRIAGDATAVERLLYLLALAVYGAVYG